MKQRIYAVALFALALLGAGAAWAGGIFQADSPINVSSYIAANNVNSIVVTTKSSVVYSIDAFNNSTTLAYIKLYNASSATCGSGTPQARYMIPFGTSSSGGGFGLPNINGDSYVNGITMCITTGIADNDTGAPAAGTYIANIHFKPVQP